MKSLAAYLRIASGVEIGTNDFRVSDMGPDGSTLFDSRSPDAAFSSATGEYLVIWQGEDDTELLVDNEFEISVQALNGSNGGQVGANDLRISSMGPDGDTLFGALNPAIAVRGGTGELLAAWQRDDDRVGLSEQEFEVFGQRLTPAAPVPPTPTHTPNPATSTPTATPIPPTATTTPTNTQPGPSNTPTRTPTPTNTQPGPTSTPTKTPPPSATAPAGGYLIYLPITIRK